MNTDEIMNNDNLFDEIINIPVVSDGNSGGSKAMYKTYKKIH